MSVDQRMYKDFEDILDTYMPVSGEGETKASQLVTAVNKLVYKWYNDGDVYDNTSCLSGWANDLSSYANWIYKYFPTCRSTLDRIFDCEDDSDYEDLLFDLANLTLGSGNLEDLSGQSAVGSIYNCEGPFEFKETYDAEYEEEEMWEDEEEEEIESSTDITAASDSENEALEEQMRNLKDDFDFILSGLEKLDRSSAEDSRIALEIAEKFSSALQETISAISERF